MTCAKVLHSWFTLLMNSISSLSMSLTTRIFILERKCRAMSFTASLEEGRRREEERNEINGKEKRRRKEERREGGRTTQVLWSYKQACTFHSLCSATVKEGEERKSRRRGRERRKRGNTAFLSTCVSVPSIPPPPTPPQLHHHMPLSLT